MARRISPLGLALGAGTLWLVLRPKTADAASNAPAGPQPLYAGVPYLFFVRLPKADDLEASVTLKTNAQALLAQKAATMVTFSLLSDGGELVSFRAVPPGNATIELGSNFYGIGTLEKVTRLDGRPFASRPA